MSLKGKIISSKKKLTARDIDINFPLESFTIQEVIDYVIEHCVVNPNQFNFLEQALKIHPFIKTLRHIFLIAI